ncbi:Na+/H+ antiporter subunit E [Ramlibacter sp. AN1015]|uniref:Na+/H+ antiporter subunit E n=1 Tax=Ramlibacter sp. AN1015 TaxID=3133428 RepID=UPI0030C44409
MVLLKRFLQMAFFWLVLTAGDPHAWAVGALACAAAALVSLRLLPPVSQTVRLRVLLRVFARFVHGSLSGGVDVARRALHPALPIRPGWLRHPWVLPPGPSRKLLGDLLSLMPGTLPAGDDGHTLLIHCLDRHQPVLRDAAALERELCELLGRQRGHRHG